MPTTGGSRGPFETPELPDRVQRLLSALVCEYIEHGEPVSSQWLAGHAGCAVSSATVRNVLARLEEQGFVRQPHTSAGRVPDRPRLSPLRRLDHGRAAPGPPGGRGRGAAAPAARCRTCWPAPRTSCRASRTTWASPGRPAEDGTLERIEFVPLEGVAHPRRRGVDWRRSRPQGDHIRRCGDARGAGAVGELPDRRVRRPDAVRGARAGHRADARRARALRRAARAVAAAGRARRSRRCRPTASCSSRARRRSSITGSTRRRCRRCARCSR